MTSDSSSPLAAYGQWLADCPREWPSEALHIARRSLIDTVAVMVPGAADSAPAKLWPLVSTWGSGPSVAVLQPQTLSPPNAALFNGTAAHAMDFDDNFDPAKAHASAVLIPALLAIGDLEESSIGDVLDGYITGLQIMGLVGQAVNPFHRSRGWHATGTLGAIGAAAGCARMLGLDATHAAIAVSISTSLAGGFMSQFGSDTKPLHAGLAAAGGVQAALFARAGLTAGEATLDGQTGMRTLMVGQDVEDLAREMEGKAEHGQTMRFSTENIGEPLHVLEHGLKVKRFPNCGSLHRSLDGLLELREAHGFGPDDVDHVLVRAPAAHLRNLMHENPQTPSEAKFSLEYSMAGALVTGASTLSDYLPESIQRPEVREQMPKIRKEYVELLESEFPTEVHVTLNNGQTLSTSVPMPVGSKAVPMSDAQLWAKLEGCLDAAPQFAQREALLEVLGNLDAERPLRHLTGALQA
ncbi:MmgE/PrpD family protein [Altererythrobacter sp. MF3-039]|uniref:MmgE/PrpD family protein n=1 Tax=Altererythrobacter sp. MF3-039 TaxID=3252901 RepID=UPI00390C6887